jgi:hypothetical protein
MLHKITNCNFMTYTKHMTFKHSIRSTWQISNWGLLRTNWQRQLLHYWKSDTVGDSITKYFLRSETVYPTQKIRNLQMKISLPPFYHAEWLTTLWFWERVLRNTSQMETTLHVTQWKKPRRDKQLYTAGNVNFRHSTSLTLPHPLRFFLFVTHPFAETAHTPP